MAVYKTLKNQLLDTDVEIVGTLDDAMSILESLKVKWYKASNLRIEKRYGYDGDHSHELYGDRTENDKERDDRLATAKTVRENKKKAKENKEKNELEELARLKDKYEK